MRKNPRFPATPRSYGPFSEFLERRRLLDGAMLQDVVTGYIGINNLTFIHVSLERITYDYAASPIESSRDTWVLIHGRQDSADAFKPMAREIDKFKPDDQVLVLNWSEGAWDNHDPTPGTGLDGAGWITKVADWAAKSLADLNVTGPMLSLVGHSWGTFVAYEIATRVSGMERSIVALDPAGGAFGYDRSVVNFNNVSSNSWGFYGNGGYGSDDLTATAKNAFVLQYEGATPNPVLDPLNFSAMAHSAPRTLFESIVADHATHRISEIFSLSNLINNDPGLWLHNQYSDTWLAHLTAFEGRFTVSESNGDGKWGSPWNEVVNFEYVAVQGGTVTVSGTEKSVSTPDVTPPRVTYFEVGGLFGFIDRTSNRVGVRVEYSDDITVDSTSIDSRDVYLQGPNSFSEDLVLTSVSTSGSRVVAYYDFVAPGGSWDPGDSGRYSLYVRSDQVLDVSQNAVPGGFFGAFDLTIPEQEIEVLPGEPK